MNTRAIATALGGLGLFLVLGAAFRVHAVQGRGLPAFPYSRSRLSDEEWLALGSKAGWKTAAVPAAEGGVLLRALVRAPRAPGAPWVLFFQGNSNRLLFEGQEFLEALAGQADLGLAVVAWRGFDGSGGTPRRDDLVADAVAQVGWLRQHGAGSAPLHLVGFSMGTLPTVAAALAAQAGTEGLRPRSVTLLAPFTALQMSEAGRLGRYLTAQDWDLLPLLGGLTVPALVVHGGADETLPVEMGRAVARAIPGARFVEAPGQGHLSLMLDERALAAVRAQVLGRE